MSKAIRELIIFIFILVVLAAAMHKEEWLSHPVEHFAAVFRHPIPYHPLLYAFFVYLAIGVVRVIVGFALKILKRQ